MGKMNRLLQTLHWEVKSWGEKASGESLVHGPEQEVPSVLSFSSEILGLISPAFRKGREGVVWGPESLFPLFPVVNCECKLSL